MPQQAWRTSEPLRSKGCNHGKEMTTATCVSWSSQRSPGVRRHLYPWIRGYEGRKRWAGLVRSRISQREQASHFSCGLCDYWLAADCARLCLRMVMDMLGLSVAEHLLGVAPCSFPIRMRRELKETAPVFSTTQAQRPSSTESQRSPPHAAGSVASVELSRK